MLHTRTYEPSEGEILYHYCDADAFAAINKSRRIRLSDLFSMNDFMEMHWGYHIWELAASELMKEVGEPFLDEIDTVIHSNGFYLLLVGSCFSLDGDVLSQWRAYSKDGMGYSIGFEAIVLAQLQIRPLRVLYDKTQQIEEAKAFIRAIHEVEALQEVNYGADFRRTCATFACDLASFKNPAFEEEQEVRIVHALDFVESSKSVKLVDAGGHAFENDVEGEEVQFRMKDSRPVAYIDIDFSNDGKINPVKEVFLGPKNNSNPIGISIFLETIGIDNVKVRMSKASYK